MPSFEVCVRNANFPEFFSEFENLTSLELDWVLTRRSHRQPLRKLVKQRKVTVGVAWSRIQTWFKLVKQRKVTVGVAWNHIQTWLLVATVLPLTGDEWHASLWWTQCVVKSPSRMGGQVSWATCNTEQHSWLSFVVRTYVVITHLYGNARVVMVTMQVNREAQNLTPPPPGEIS